MSPYSNPSILNDTTHGLVQVSTTHTELKVQMDTTKATETGEVHWSHDLVIDSTNGFTFSLFTQLQTTVTLFDPSGARVDLEIAESNSTVPLADSGVDGHGTEAFRDDLIHDPRRCPYIA